MNILVCIKRVPVPGAKFVLTENEQSINTRNLGFAVSPHEECAVEEAIRQVKEHGGTTTVLTLGPEAASDQLRFTRAMGIDHMLLVETDESEWGAMATANSITKAIKTQQELVKDFDAIFFGNESADAGGYQVGIRVAYALDLPCVSGIKSLEINGNIAQAKREIDGSWEVIEVTLPAVFTIKEGINVPRYPTLPGRLKAQRDTVDVYPAELNEDGLHKVRLVTPEGTGKDVQILGEGVEAVPRIIDLLRELRIIES